MVSATTATATATPNNNSLTNIVGNKAKHAKALGFGGLLTAGMCIFDFCEVPGAFSLKNDYEGKPVEGLNVEAGVKETIWSAVKCATATFALPWVIGMIATPFAPVAATIAAAVKIAAPFIGYKVFERIRPHEKEVIEKICQAKAAGTANTDTPASMSETGTYKA